MAETESAASEAVPAEEQLLSETAVKQEETSALEKTQAVSQEEKKQEEEEELPTEWKCSECDLINDYYSLTCQACLTDYSGKDPKMKEVCGKTHSKKFQPIPRGWYQSMYSVVRDPQTERENRRRLRELKRRDLLIMDYFVQLDATPFGIALCKQFDEEYVCVVVPEATAGQQGLINGSQVIAIDAWLAQSEHWSHVNHCYKNDGFSYFSGLDKVAYMKKLISERDLSKKPIRLILRFDPLKLLTMTMCPSGGIPCEWWPNLLDEVRLWALENVPSVWRVCSEYLTVWDHLPCEKIDKNKQRRQIYEYRQGEDIEGFSKAGAFIRVKKPRFGWVKFVNSDGSKNLTLVKEAQSQLNDQELTRLGRQFFEGLKNVDESSKNASSEEEEKKEEEAKKDDRLVPKDLAMVKKHRGDLGDVFGMLTIYKDGQKVELETIMREVTMTVQNEDEDGKQQDTTSNPPVSKTMKVANPDQRRWLSDYFLLGPFVVNIAYWMCDMAFESSESMHSANLKALRQFAETVNAKLDAPKVQINVVKVCVLNSTVDSEFAQSMPAELEGLDNGGVSVVICAVQINDLKPWGMSNFSGSIFKYAHLVCDSSWKLLVDPRDEITSEKVVWKLTGLFD